VRWIAVPIAGGTIFPTHPIFARIVGCILAVGLTNGLLTLNIGRKKKEQKNSHVKRDEPTMQSQIEGRVYMITIKKSETADTRTCDWSKVSKEQLLASSIQHIGDVAVGFEFFKHMLTDASERHDFDKISKIDWFYADFKTGFKQTGWWDNHRKVNRHHLLQMDGVPSDVNLVDVLDMIVDCVMAGMARTGSVYPLDISHKVLEMAFQNTVELLKSVVVVSND